MINIVKSSKPIKVLVINDTDVDYLGDGVLIGLLNNDNVDVYQYPGKDVLYKANKGEAKIYGNGFTLYYIFDGPTIKIGNPDQDLMKENNYDLIIFLRIQVQFDLFKKYLPYLKNKTVWILDGEDTPAMYPYHGYYWRKPSLWFLPKAHRQFLYFKREWTPETLHYLRYKLMPRSLSKLLPAPKNLRSISFSIPASKILHSMPEKKKLFPLHIVDEEVAANVEGSFTGYVFESESDYYTDIQQSKYGITTKRSGWDCLRHYEIAANRSIICFRNLDKKPFTCAPHGLLDGTNCISYSSYSELMEKINAVSDEKYIELQEASYQWVQLQTCEYQAAKLLQEYL